MTLKLKSGLSTRSKLLGLFFVSLNLVNTAHAESVSGKQTHSISVPSSGSIFSRSTITWQPLSAYSNHDFSYVKLGIKRPGENWTYRNENGSSYSLTPSKAGTWCFRVRGRYTDHFGAFTSQKCMSVSDSVSGKVTHSLNVPGSAYVWDNATISWSEVSPYNIVDFKHVKVAIGSPDGSWTYPNESSSSRSVPIDAEGSWCFKVRGYPRSGGSGSAYTSLKCLNATSRVKDKVTHQVNAITGEFEGEDMSVSWSPLSAFSNLHFNRYIVSVLRPDNTGYTDTITSGSIYEFKPNQAGEWCFKVRGRYDIYGKYSSFQCHTIKDRNLIVGGHFNNGVQAPWNLHEELHTGRKIAANGKVTFTSPDLSEQTKQLVDGGFKDFNDFHTKCKGNELPKKDRYRCRKSEISFDKSKFTDSTEETPGTEGTAGTTTWFAYEFVVNNFYDHTANTAGGHCQILEDDLINDNLTDEEKLKRANNVCGVFISQFHTTSLLRELSPNNAIQLKYNVDQNAIEMFGNTKQECPGLEGQASDCWRAGDFKVPTGTARRKIEEGKVYLLKMRIKWENSRTGEVDVYVKGEDEGDFQLALQGSNLQTLPIHPVDTKFRVKPQMGLYWANLDPWNLYEDGENGNPMSVTMDDVWMTREACHLPEKYQGGVDNCQQ